MRRTGAPVLWSLIRGQPRTGSLADRLEAFYRPQAAAYDAFRERLLHGRSEMLALLHLAPGHSVVELGGGTARNLEFYEDRIGDLASVTVVDICPALLERARLRCRRWANVEVVEADALDYRPAAPVDRVYFSYSLTMMPRWRHAIDNALGMLKPGGLLGVVDFFVSHPAARPGPARHGPATRWFWSRWFAHDGVHPNPRHADRLEAACETLHHAERLGSVPFLPIEAPYYIFVGRKPLR